MTHTCTQLCVCVCVCVSVRESLSVRVFVIYEDTHLYNDMGIWHRYYNEKVIYEDIFSVPIIQKAYKSYRMSFFWESFL